MRTKIAVLLLVAFAGTAGAAGWKWQAATHGKSNYKIAGWTWGDDAAARGIQL